jgi:hypothetical protein
MIKSRRMKWIVHVENVGQKRNAYRGLVSKIHGREPFEGPRLRWENNIKKILNKYCGKV